MAKVEKDLDISYAVRNEIHKEKKMKLQRL